MKIAFVALAAGVAYRLYQLYQVGERLVYSVGGLRFKRVGTALTIFVLWKIDNRTQATANIKGVRGKLFLMGKEISTFEGPAAAIKPGPMDYTTEFKINNVETAIAIVSSILAGKWPVFTVEMDTKLGLFTASDKYDINTKDYVTDILTSLKG